MKKKWFSSLMILALVISMGNSVWASTEDEIAYAREMKADAEASLAAAQANINSLESKKQELEYYLADLNEQYTQLSGAIAELDAQTTAKEEELIQVKAELKVAQLDKQNQYEAMKLRIVYMFEHGGDNALLTLLSSKSFADFLNYTENVVELSNYDRNMLKKFEETCTAVEEKEESVNKEIDELAALLNEKTVKQQEVENLVASTNANIQSYVYQISASEEEASYLMAEVNRAENSIYDLMVRAEAEAEAARAAAEREAYEEHYDDDSYDSDEEYYDSYEDSYDSDDDYYEESYDDSYEEDSYYEEESSYQEESSSGSGSGTYLGTFKLTGYCNCASCCGIAGNATASGVYPTSGHTVAMAGVPFGTQLLINGCVYTVEDLGTPYGHVDIFFDSHSTALNFGLQYADVYRLN